MLYDIFVWGISALSWVSDLATVLILILLYKHTKKG